MTDAFDAKRYATLMSHQTHEQALPELIEIEESRETIDEAAFSIRLATRCQYIYVDSEDGKWAVSIPPSREIDHMGDQQVRGLIALLQRAAQIIEGGAS